MKKDILVPNIGEFKDVEVIEVIAKNSENLKKNDPLITIESDKSSVEIPSPFDGKVDKIYLKVGDKVSEGDKILSLELSDSIKSELKVEKNNINQTETVPLTSQTKNQKEQDSITYQNPNSNKILASPKARKFARELGVNVKEIIGTQRLGRVVEDDIKNFVSKKISLNFENKEEKKDKKIKSEYNHSDFGEIENSNMPRIKRIAAPHLTNSWNNIPHVTNHDEADVTEMEEFRNSLRDIYTGEKKKDYTFSIYY